MAETNFKKQTIKRKEREKTMMKNIAGALLVGLTVLTFTPAAFAGQAAQAGQAREFVGGYHVTATDDCAGNLN